MSIDAAAVAKIARLASLEVADAEKERLARELSGILKWVEQLSEVNTDNVPQLASVSETALPLRADEITAGNCREAVLANAPATEYGCFVVPKVVE